MKKLFSFPLFLFFALQANTQTLNKTEQKILAAIETDMPATLNLLKESVNINSGTYNIAGVKRVGDLYASELKALGFTIEWVAMPDSIKRAGHLVAYRKGKKGKKLFLIRRLHSPEKLP